MFVFFLFFTTPIAIVTGLRELSRVPFLRETLAFVHTITGALGHVVFSIIPTLLLLLATTSMPYIFYVSSELEKHHTRSAKEVSAMRKTYLFLVINMVVMPGLVLTSLDALVEYTTKPDQLVLKVGRMFLIHGGAFFVAFMLTNTFIGNAADLIRFPSRLVMWWRMRGAVTEREIRRANTAEPFLYAIEYGLILALFTMAITLGTCCVLILPCAATYFLIKYVVDKYHFLHNPGLINDNVFMGDTRIVQQVKSRIVIATMVSQVAVTCFFALKQVYAAAIIAFCIFLITVGYHLWRYATSTSVLVEYTLPDEITRSDEHDATWRARAALYRHPLLEGISFDYSDTGRKGFGGDPAGMEDQGLYGYEDEVSMH